MLICDEINGNILKLQCLVLVTIVKVLTDCLENPVAAFEV